MVRRIGLVLWWVCLAVAVVIVERLVDAIPLWQLIFVAVILGCAAIPCMFWRDIRQWRSRRLVETAPGPENLTDEADEDREAVRINPGNGRRVTRLIMKAATLEEIDDFFGDFNAIGNRTSEIDVAAALRDPLMFFVKFII